jgi:hypothetical protein
MNTLVGGDSPNTNLRHAESGDASNNNSKVNGWLTKTPKKIGNSINFKGQTLMI